MKLPLTLAAHFGEGIQKLCLASRLLGYLEAVQSGNLHIEITYPAGTPAQPAQQLQQLFVIAAQFGWELLQQRLQPPRIRAELVDIIGLGLIRQFVQLAIQFLKHKTGALSVNWHRSKTWGVQKYRFIRKKTIAAETNRLPAHPLTADNRNSS